MIIREEQKHEKEIIAKGGGQYKLLYRYINKKMQHRVRLKDRKELYEEPKDISKLLNESF